MIKFEMHQFLDDETIDKLWAQGVNMDDWDYFLFVDEEFKDNFYNLNDDHRDTLKPKSDSVDALLHGCCANEWYQVDDFKGKKGILGVAYHA